MRNKKLDLININGENNLKKYNVSGIVFDNQFRHVSVCTQLSIGCEI